jgi:hypothetical protein
VAETVTVGGVMLGYCETAMIESANRPANVMTMAITMAKFGR